MKILTEQLKPKNQQTILTLQNDMKYKNEENKNSHRQFAFLLVLMQEK